MVDPSFELFIPTFSNASNASEILHLLSQEEVVIAREIDGQTNVIQLAEKLGQEFDILTHTLRDLESRAILLLLPPSPNQASSSSEQGPKALGRFKLTKKAIKREDFLAQQRSEAKASKENQTGEEWQIENNPLLYQAAMQNSLSDIYDAIESVEELPSTSSLLSEDKGFVFADDSSSLSAEEPTELSPEILAEPSDAPGLSAPPSAAPTSRKKSRFTRMTTFQSAPSNPSTEEDSLSVAEEPQKHRESDAASPEEALDFEVERKEKPVSETESQKQASEWRQSEPPAEEAISSAQQETSLEANVTDSNSPSTVSKSPYNLDVLYQLLEEFTPGSEPPEQTQPDLLDDNYFASLSSVRPKEVQTLETPEESIPSFESDFEHKDSTALSAEAATPKPEALPREAETKEENMLSPVVSSSGQTALADDLDFANLLDALPEAPMTPVPTFSEEEWTRAEQPNASLAPAAEFSEEEWASEELVMEEIFLEEVVEASEESLEEIDVQDVILEEVSESSSEVLPDRAEPAFEPAEILLDESEEVASNSGLTVAQILTNAAGVLEDDEGENTREKRLNRILEQAPATTSSLPSAFVEAINRTFSNPQSAFLSYFESEQPTRLYSMARSAMIQLIPDVEVYKQQVKESPPHVSVHLLLCLVELEETEALDKLIKFIATPEPEIQALLFDMADFFLSRSDSRQKNSIRGKIRDLLNSQNRDERELAYRWLKKANVKPWFSLPLKLLSEDRPLEFEELEMIAKLCCRYIPNKAIVVLEKLAEPAGRFAIERTSRKQRRLVAVESLATIGDRKTEALLQKLLKSSKGGLKDLCLYSIEQIRHRHPK